MLSSSLCSASTLATKSPHVGDTLLHLRALNRKLSIGKAQWRGEDFRVGGIVEAGVEFADALSCFEVVRDMTLAEVFGLVFEVVKTGI